MRQCLKRHSCNDDYGVAHGWDKQGAPSKQEWVRQAGRQAYNPPCHPHHDLPLRHTCMQINADEQASRLWFTYQACCLLEARQRLASGREMIRFESSGEAYGKEGRTAPTHSTHVSCGTTTEDGFLSARRGASTLLSRRDYQEISTGSCAGACFNRFVFVLGGSDV